MGQGAARSNAIATQCWLSLVLIMASNACGAQEADHTHSLQETEVRPSDQPGWLDNSHGYLTEQTNELTRWVDGYFGATEVDQEAASSRLRLRLIADEDARLGNDFKVRVGGKVNLPAISKRLDLVFRDNDPADDINGQADPAQSNVGLQYELGERKDKRHRFDLSLGMSSSGPRPGLKYRYVNSFSERSNLWFAQRAQYELDEGLLHTSRLNLDHTLSDRQLLRSATRVFYGEDSQGFEWSSSVAHFLRWTHQPETFESRARATMLFAEISGVTEPWSYVSNYRLGLRYRHQTARDYLFIELEPSYNWRIDEPGLPRRGAFGLQLRFEFLLFDDLRRDKHDDSGAS